MSIGGERESEREREREIKREKKIYMCTEGNDHPLEVHLLSITYLLSYFQPLT